LQRRWLAATQVVRKMGSVNVGRFLRSRRRAIWDRETRSAELIVMTWWACTCLRISTRSANGLARCRLRVDGTSFSSARRFGAGGRSMTAERHDGYAAGKRRSHGVFADDYGHRPALLRLRANPGFLGRHGPEVLASQILEWLDTKRRVTVTPSQIRDTSSCTGITAVDRASVSLC